jgi:filamentous hemagglutinin family protein
MPTAMKNCTPTILISLVTLCCLCEYTSNNDISLAQILPDNTLPQNSVVTINGNVISINGGSQLGTNLFHSFQKFSVAQTNTAFFNNTINIQNILARVTGNNISQIDGILKANGTANLFLINPQGIIFGTNARLDIGGSFIASSANSINFQDGFQFSAVNPQASNLLTVSTPLGLQMGLNPQPITVRGNGDGIRTTSNLIDTLAGLRVGSTKTLALVGGDIAIAGGTLKTAGGNIELSSLGSLSQVQLNPSNRGFTLSYGATTSFQDIRLSNKASIDASGLGSGNIQVRGKTISLLGGSQIQSSTLGNQTGGTIFLKATDKIQLIGLSPDRRTASGLLAEIKPSAFGSAGNLTIETPQLLMQDRAIISVDNRGNGTGADLTIRTPTSLEAINSFITAIIRPNAQGKGGNLSFETGLLSLQGSQISADVQGKGNGGSIYVRASDKIEAIGSAPDGSPSGFLIVVGRSGTGRAGDITFDTPKLSLLSGAAISSGTFGQGDAGSIGINAADLVEIIGRDASGLRPSALVARVAATAQGKGGNIAIATNRLVVDQRAVISVSDDAGIKGAGNVQINANFMLLDRGSALSASTKAGTQGNIFLNTSNLQMFNNSQIQANALGFATGGNIKIITDTLVALGNSDITANAQQAAGGRVIINAQGVFGTAFRRVLTPQSDITASSELGAEFSGVVQLNITGVDPSKGLNKAPLQIIDSSHLIVQRCQADVTQSKFTITGKGGLPPSPNAIITASNIHEIVGSSEPIANSPTDLPQIDLTNEIIEANNWKMEPNGRIVALINSHSPNSLNSSNINSWKPCN